MFVVQACRPACYYCGVVCYCEWFCRFFCCSKGSIKELFFCVFPVFGYLKILKVLDLLLFLVGGAEAEQFWNFYCRLLVLHVLVR